MTLTPAHISWRGSQPYADDYADIYFAADGIAEVDRVFMAPCALPARAGARITVGELGFGTGLNFAVCATRMLAESNSRLHFVSFEKHPLTHQDWQRVGRHYQDTLPIYAELIANPPPVLPGWQRRVLANGRVTLSVYHGDVSEGLADLNARQSARVDAWFLDGFAPSSNPAMWAPGVFDGIAALAAPGCHAATFTAAGNVRRELTRVGFTVDKVDQRPHKRESLRGVRPDGNAQPRTPATICVLGAGIGGATLARHFADQGVHVTVYDPAGIAGGASAVPSTVLHGRLLGDGSAQAELRAAAFHYATAYLHGRSGSARSGAVQLQGPNMDGAKLRRICAAYDADADHQHFWLQQLGPEAASERAGCTIGEDALYFPTAGTVNLPELCANLLDHSGIEVRQERGTLDPDSPTVLCTGTAAREWFDWLEVADVHGQLDHYQGRTDIKLPVVGNGYFVPEAGGFTLGATYEYDAWEAGRATTHNREINAHLLRACAEMSWQGTSRGARAVTSDRMPIIGRLADNVWIATGYGSMGTTAGPLGAAMVLAELLGWVPPVSAAATAAIKPQRFLERQARRGVRHR